MKFEEMEVKYLLRDPVGYEARLRHTGAVLVHPRVHEMNWRFDRPDRSLTLAHQVLRLRQDERIRLTFKGPARLDQAVSLRDEIEFEVNDLEAAKKFLLALGYEVSIRYEKFRTTYDLDGAEIAIDEMPFGFFTEIEASEVDLIRNLSQKLNLKWEHRILESYLSIFNRFNEGREASIRDLIFENFSGVPFSAHLLSLEYADGDK